MKDRKLLNIELGRISAGEYSSSRPQSGVVLVLDNIRSAHNVGSAFRTADAFGVDKVWLGGICPVPPSPELHKVALGAEEAVPFEHVSDVVALVRQLQADGYTVIAVEQTVHSVKLNEFFTDDAPRENSVPLRSTPAPPTVSCVPASQELVSSGPLPLPVCGGAHVSQGASSVKYALVFGNEVAGVQQEVVDACDFALEIPQKGTKHSLNVSVSIGVVLWAVMERL